MSNLYFQSQVDEGHNNLTRRQEVSATNVLFRGEILLYIKDWNLISLFNDQQCTCTLIFKNHFNKYIFFVLQDLESKVAELQRREQELQRMQFGGMAMLWITIDFLILTNNYLTWHLVIYYCHCTLLKFRFCVNCHRHQIRGSLSIHY